MTDTEFRIDWHDSIAIMTLTRPAKLNALTAGIMNGLSEVLDDLSARDNGGLIITSESRAFSAGTDLTEMSALATEEMLAKCRFARALFTRLYRSPITSVAAIPDLAYGGGLELALACTFRVAAPGARLAMPEIKLGVLPAYGGTQLLPRVVGPSLALDLMLTGRSVTAEEALTTGLVTRLAPSAEELLNTAVSLMAEINQHSLAAIRGIREAVRIGLGDISDEGLQAEEEALARAVQSLATANGVGQIDGNE